MPEVKCTKAQESYKEFACKTNKNTQALYEDGSMKKLGREVRYRMKGMIAFQGRGKTTKWKEYYRKLLV